jgi:hypothetical protein
MRLVTILNFIFIYSSYLKSLLLFCNSIISFIKDSPESWNVDRKDPNPWIAGGGGDGGCCTIS